MKLSGNIQCWAPCPTLLRRSTQNNSSVVHLSWCPHKIQIVTVLHQCTILNELSACCNRTIDNDYFLCTKLESGYNLISIPRIKVTFTPCNTTTTTTTKPKLWYKRGRQLKLRWQRKKWRNTCANTRFHGLVRGAGVCGVTSWRVGHTHCSSN